MPLEPAVQTLLDATATHWARNDANALASLFAPDGTLINPFGQRADGRDAVADMYRTFFADGMLLHASTTTIDIESLRTCGDDTAFLDATQQLYRPDGETLLVLHLAAFLRRTEGTWQYVDARPYQPIPAAIRGIAAQSDRGTLAALASSSTDGEA